MRYHIEFEPKYESNPESYDLWTLIEAQDTLSPLEEVEEAWLHDDQYLYMVDVIGVDRVEAFIKADDFIMEYISKKEKND